eukprot:2217035-Pyramimonas_sp.AAC.1
MTTVSRIRRPASDSNMICGPQKEGPPPETSSLFTHRRGPRSILPSHSSLKSPKVTTVTRCG